MTDHEASVASCVATTEVRNQAYARDSRTVKVEPLSGTLST